MVLASFLREPLEMMETFELSSDSIQRVKKYVWKYIMRMIYNCVCDKFLILNLESKGGALPPADAMCGLSLSLVVSLALRGFSPGTRFSPPLKKQHFEIPVRSGIR